MYIFNQNIEQIFFLCQIFLFNSLTKLVFNQFLPRLKKLYLNHFHLYDLRDSFFIYFYMKDFVVIFMIFFYDFERFHKNKKIVNKIYEQKTYTVTAYNI